eukprot:scaffold86281_cov27-Tisochrysis_lutea.AAC.3
MSEQRLWRNRQKLYDSLLSLQRDFPNGQSSSLSANPPALADAAARLRTELLDSNLRWFSLLFTQRMVNFVPFSRMKHQLLIRMAEHIVVDHP